jgi:hypothetical protein
LFYAFLFLRPLKITPLLNLSPIISGLTPFGWVRSVEPTPTISTVSYENIIFDLRLFYLLLLFQKSNLDVKQGLGVFHLQNMRKRQDYVVQVFKAVHHVTRTPYVCGAWMILILAAVLYYGC